MRNVIHMKVRGWSDSTVSWIPITNMLDDYDKINHTYTGITEALQTYAMENWILPIPTVIDRVRRKLSPMSIGGADMGNANACFLIMGEL